MLLPHGSLWLMNSCCYHGASVFHCCSWWLRTARTFKRRIDAADVFCMSPDCPNNFLSFSSFFLWLKGRTSWCCCIYWLLWEFLHYSVQIVVCFLTNLAALSRQFCQDVADFPTTLFSSSIYLHVWVIMFVKTHLKGTWPQIKRSIC